MINMNSILTVTVSSLMRLEVLAEVTEYYFLLGCDTVQFSKYVLTFRRWLILLSSNYGIILQDKENSRTGTGTIKKQTINYVIEWGRGGFLG
jgi:hypothetical protein